MRIEQLQAFLAVAETGNFGQAAKKCGVTQSTISRQIQSLESTLGLPLFHRTTQAKLTLAGERFLPRARKICQEWQNITQELGDLLAGKQPELCVAAIHSVCSYHLPPGLQKFCQSYSNVQLRVTALGSDRALKVLRDGLVDIAIVMNNPFLTTSPEMIIDPLFEEPIEVLMSSQHPLTKYQQLNWPELVRFPHVVFKDGYGMQRLVQEWFSNQNASLQIAMELNTLDSPEELAGMLDTYNQLGPQLQPLVSPPAYPVTVFSIPYDGRSRTAPVTPITALILAAAGVPVILHGGDRMPTQYGIPLVEMWQGLGVDFSPLTLSQTQHLFEQTQLGFIYLPQHFPLAHQLIPYRDQIGKRPPIATLELIWSPYAGDAHLVSGFVHPPTEERLRTTFDLLGEIRYTTVKGLEGSCDLACSRPAIIGVGRSGTHSYFERLHLHPHEYGLGGKDVELESSAKLNDQLQTVLAGRSGELMPAAIWNGGFYLWNCGVCPDLQAGIGQAEQMLTQGVVAQKLEEIIQVINSLQLASPV